MVKEKNKYEIAIVVDGNSSIGMGHIMRCGAIADALKDMGRNVLFIVSDKESENKVKELGFDVHCMDTDYKKLDGQAERIIECLSEHGAGFVFFDSYFASNELFDEVSLMCPVGCFGYGKKYRHGMCLIVPYGISSDKQWYEDSFHKGDVNVLFGSKYVPLKKSFWNLPLRDGDKKVERLLLTSGGTDSFGISAALIDNIRRRKIDIQIDLVVGQFYDTKMIRKICNIYSDIVCYENLTDLSALMSSVDVAISSGGITLYELMASSVPTIAYALADNQLGNEQLNGAVKWCGDVRKGDILNLSIVDRIVSELEILINDGKKRNFLIRRGRDVCDGHGAERIAQMITEIIMA